MTRLILRLMCTTAAVCLTTTVAFADAGTGAYLAASAATRAGAYADGARYYRQGLIEAPDDPLLAQGAMMTHVALGQVADAVPFARRFQALAGADEFSNILLPVAAMVDGNYAAAADVLLSDQANANPLVQQLLAGWALIGAGRFADGVVEFQVLNQSPGLAGIGLYHQALANAYAGNFEAAAALLDAAGDSANLNRNAIVARAEILGAMENYDAATALMTAGAGARLNDPEAADLRQKLQAGAPIEFTRIQNTNDGAAEALMLMAEALSNDDAGRLALFFARLAAYLEPGRADALIMAGDLLVDDGQGELALLAYAAVAPDDPLALTALSGQVVVWQATDRTDMAIDALLAATRRSVDNISLLNMLGDALRRQQRWAESAIAYSQAIAAAPNPEAVGLSRMYFSRAISRERAGDWPGAEEDFRLALRLQPNQANVLNYLGYSLVDRGENLDEALGMIQRAMELRPNDGLITDSLAWAYFQLGRYQDALDPMQKAVLLRPDEPVLNDHYGDVLWMVGRQREARFQWERALLAPDADVDPARVRDKLARGLDAVLADEGHDAN